MWREFVTLFHAIIIRITVFYKIVWQMIAARNIFLRTQLSPTRDNKRKTTVCVAYVCVCTRVLCVWFKRQNTGSMFKNIIKIRPGICRDDTTPLRAADGKKFLSCTLMRFPA